MYLKRLLPGCIVISHFFGYNDLQADLLGSPVIRPADIETTALGAAYAAGLAVGVWTEDEIFASGEKVKTSTVFRPVLDEELRKKKVASWCKAVTRTFDLADLSL